MPNFDQLRSSQFLPKEQDFTSSSSNDHTLVLLEALGPSAYARSSELLQDNQNQEELSVFDENTPTLSVHNGSNVSRRKRYWDSVDTDQEDCYLYEAPRPMPPKNSKKKIYQGDMVQGLWKSHEVVKCSNECCAIELSPLKTSQWRYFESDKNRLYPYCSSCKNYYDHNGKMRPKEGADNNSSKKFKLNLIPFPERKCTFCDITKTSLWRFVGDDLSCNACYMRSRRGNLRKPLR